MWTTARSISHLDLTYFVVKDLVPCRKCDAAPRFIRPWPAGEIYDSNNWNHLVSLEIRNHLYILDKIHWSLLSFKEFHLYREDSRNYKLMIIWFNEIFTRMFPILPILYTRELSCINSKCPPFTIRVPEYLMYVYKGFRVERIYTGHKICNIHLKHFRSDTRIFVI
jgi:hypothetical protein